MVLGSPGGSRIIYLAADGADAVEVEYEPLPPVLDAADIAAGTSVLHVIDQVLIPSSVALPPAT